MAQMLGALRQKLSVVGSGSVSLSFLNHPTKASVAGRIGRISINNAQHKNALSGKMMVDLFDCVSTIEKEPDIAMILVVGEGDFFCSGADLSVIKQIEGDVMCRFMQETTLRLRNLDAISIACVRGGCVGGGTELATACDLRVFESNATWRCVHPKMGISPGWGGGRRLHNLLGRSRAIEILCSARKLTAEECSQIGLVSAICPPNKDLEQFVLERFGSFAENPVDSVRACKRSVCATSDEQEREIFCSVWGGKDFKEAVARAIK